MDLRKEDLPATLQAFELLDNKEIFLAEQVVNSQADIDKFTARYAGKLIKAKAEVPYGTNPRSTTTNYDQTVTKRKSSASLVMIIIILIIAALVVYGFATGWLQQKLHLNV